MVLIVLSLTYIAILAFIYGTAATSLIRRLFQDSIEVPFAITNITGLVVLAVTSGYLSIFIKIGLLANVLVSLLAIILIILYKFELHRQVLILVEKASRLSKSIWVLVVIACAVVVIEGTLIPKVGDSGLYHIQTIKWIESYRVVPGLGNLHGFFAWNSMWYPLSALFGFSFFGIQSLHVVNGAFYLFALAYFLGGVAEFMEGKYRFTSFVKAVAIPFSLFVYSPQIGSPSTDLPSALLVWITCLLLLEKEELPVQPDTWTATSLIISTYAVTVKLSVVPVVLLWIFLFFRQYRRAPLGKLGIQAALVVAILIPWIVRNIVLSGYLIYPIASIDLFNVNWKLPFRYVFEEKLVAHGWARLPGPDWRASLDMPLSMWTSRWYGWLPYHYKTAITATALVTVAHLGAFAFRPSGWLKQLKKPDIFLFVYLTACLGVLYWFLNAPDPRFGFGFIFLAFVLPITKLMQWFTIKYPLAARQMMISILLVYMLNHGFLSIQGLPKNTNNLLSPTPYPVVALETKTIDLTVFYFPITTDQCWYAPLPCMPVLNPGLRLRGDTLQSGFMIGH